MSILVRLLVSLRLAAKSYEDVEVRSLTRIKVPAEGDGPEGADPRVNTEK
jgi:hypothetical protein